MNFGSVTHQKGVALRGMLITAALLALGALLLLPKYLFELEKADALAMQAMLINTSIAEQSYHAAYGAYSANWADIKPYLTVPTSLEVSMQAVGRLPSDYFFGFGKRGQNKKDGYIVTLLITPDGKSGQVSAARSGSVRYHYELSRQFPTGQTTCRAAGGANTAFCRYFAKAAAALELANLSPAPENAATGPNATPEAQP